jgi:UDPglucose--hexose-1-phosphate uridylyltransferase
MAEFRRDPLTGAGVIIAQNRGDRPHEFGTARRVRTAQTCPFCEGNERETPPEVFALRADGSPPDRPGWRVRIVPNKYPAVVPAPAAVLQAGEEEALWDLAGVHEVVIESPRHLQRTSEFQTDELVEVLFSYRDRLRSLKNDGRLAYAIIFKNVGPDAGATIEHAHSQLVALPIVPDQINIVRHNTQRYHDEHGECLFCKVTTDEIDARKRIIASTDDLVAFCPFASRVPYETRIAPRGHEMHFPEIKADTISQLASLLKSVVAKIDDVLHNPDYNYIIHTAPFDTAGSQNYHWYMAILPRLTTLAGFEWGTGCTINAVSPESAARRLRIDELLS